MSWHYSQALVVEYLEASSTDGEQFAPLKSSDIPEAYCWHDKTTESLSLFQFGMTSDPLTADHGVDLLTWYRGGFLAKTSVLREQCGDARAWGASGQVYGGKCCALLGRFSLPMFSVKIRLLSGPQDWLKSSENLPASGMHVDGSLWELTLSDSVIDASDSGSTLPTPTARDFKDTLGMVSERKDGKTRLDRLPMLLFDAVKNAGMCSTTNWANTGVQTVNLKDLVNTTISGPAYCPELPEWVMGWPIGWTELKPLETDKFQQWLLLHGKYCT
jgi:hypothetical protein